MQPFYRRSAGVYIDRMTLPYGASDTRGHMKYWRTRRRAGTVPAASRSRTGSDDHLPAFSERPGNSQHFRRYESRVRRARHPLRCGILASCGGGQSGSLLHGWCCRYHSPYCSGNQPDRKTAAKSCPADARAGRAGLPTRPPRNHGNARQTPNGAHARIDPSRSGHASG